MKIRFTGVIDVPDDFDDRGSVDVELLDQISDAVELDTDDAYEALEMCWEEVVCTNDQDCEIHAGDCALSAANQIGGYL